jgi:hypothetical protein
MVDGLITGTEPVMAVSQNLHSACRKGQAIAKAKAFMKQASS